MKKRISILIMLMLILSLSAQNIDILKPVSTNQTINIDGVLDEDIWASAPSLTGFKSFIPDFGIPLPEKTIAYSAYDNENLYFAFRCFDSQADQIKASITARDNIR